MLSLHAKMVLANLMLEKKDIEDTSRPIVALKYVYIYAYSDRIYYLTVLLTKNYVYTGNQNHDT